MSMENQNLPSPDKSSFIGKPEGEDFFVVEKEPQKQQFVSLLLRGPINAAQIVEKDGVYYSHKQNSQTIESQENLIVSIKADIFIISQVFRDDDHEHFRNNTSNTAANITMDETKKTYTIFDFEKAFMSKENNMNVLSDEGKKDFYHSCSEALLPGQLSENSIFKEYGPEREAILKAILDKTKALLDINFKNPEYIKAALKKTKIDLTTLNEYFKTFDANKVFSEEEMVDIIYKDIKTRLEVVSDCTE